MQFGARKRAFILIGGFLALAVVAGAGFGAYRFFVGRGEGHVINKERSANSPRKKAPQPSRPTDWPSPTRLLAEQTSNYLEADGKKIDVFLSAITKAADQPGAFFNPDNCRAMADDLAKAGGPNDVISASALIQDPILSELVVNLQVVAREMLADCIEVKTSELDASLMRTRLIGKYVAMRRGEINSAAQR